MFLRCSTGRKRLFRSRKLGCAALITTMEKVSTARLTRSWARSGPAKRGRDGFVSCYELPLDGLVAIDLNGEGFTALHWLSVLFRESARQAYHSRYGAWRPLVARIISRWIWTAPTSWRVTGRMIPTLGSRAPFLSNSITLGQLTRALRLRQFGNPGDVGEPAAAFDAVRFTGYVKADAATYFPRYSERDARASGPVCADDPLLGRPGRWPFLELAHGDGEGGAGWLLTLKRIFSRPWRMWGRPRISPLPHCGCLSRNSGRFSPQVMCAGASRAACLGPWWA